MSDHVTQAMTEDARENGGDVVATICFHVGTAGDLEGLSPAFLPADVGPGGDRTDGVVELVFLAAQEVVQSSRFDDEGAVVDLNVRLIGDELLDAVCCHHAVPQGSDGGVTREDDLFIDLAVAVVVDAVELDLHSIGVDVVIQVVAIDVALESIPICVDGLAVGGQGQDEAEKRDHGTPRVVLYTPSRRS